MSFVGYIEEKWGVVGFVVHCRINDRDKLTKFGKLDFVIEVVTCNS